MTSQGMMLRNMALVGATQGMAMPPQHKPAFEAGVALLFTRWTALQLGVANEWGGPNSKDKALGIQQEVCDWFYGKKSHEMMDLADLLDQAISEDFYIQAEDDSPYQVWGHGGTPWGLAFGQPSWWNGGLRNVDTRTACTVRGGCQPCRQRCAAPHARSQHFFKQACRRLGL